MSPELASRLRVLEQQAEALVLQAGALRQQVTALVSEAEHDTLVERAEPAPTVPTEATGFYGDFTASPKLETDDATTKPRRTRRSP